MAEDPQPMTLQQRIAALNAAHIGRIPGEPPRDPPRPTPRPTPQVPVRRPELPKQKTINNPPENLNGSITDATIGNRPAPPPLPVRKQPPPLPIRKKSTDFSRRGSEESAVSAYTNGSSTRSSSAVRSESSDRIKAPAWGDCELPALPPRGAANAPRKYSTERPKYVNRAPSSTSTTTTVASTDSRRPSLPSLPPRLPPRKSQTDLRQQSMEQEARNIPPMPSMETLERMKKSALTFGMNKPQPETQPVSETRNSQTDLRQQRVEQEPRNTLPMPSMETLDRFKKSGLSFGMNKPQPEPQPVSDPLPPSRESTSSAPPPVPHSSRPDLTAIQATKPKFSANHNSIHQQSPTSSNICLVCRDFSGPDHQASLFPRQSVSNLQDLAYQLTSPFPSATDKARAIFMWLHLNVRYDVENFFRGTVKGSTPQSTLQTGLAVCEGYAALFTNLATHAGLESVVIGGHGKGYGYEPLAPGSSLPPYNAGHAWNAVKIDNNEWKLIDCCWGAGHVQGANMPYVQKFTPEYFTMSNEEFGIKHFPGNKDHFFLPGGRRMSWEEYIQINPANWPDMVESPTIYTCAEEEYYVGKKTVMPRSRYISVNSNNAVRFQFHLLCPHWTLERHTQKGPPPVFVLMIGGVDGRGKDMIPLEYVRGNGNGGDVWYLDISARELGAPGQTLTLMAITSFGDNHNPRGLTVREFNSGKGRTGMGFTGVAAWQLTA